MKALATCLGSATTGIIGRLYQQASVAGPIHAALGFMAGSGETTILEVCVAAGAPSVAQAMKARWTTDVSTGSDSRSGQA